MIKLLFLNKLLIMGYVFDFKDAVNYDQWYDKSQNRFAADLEFRLMLDMLKPMDGGSLLDIGCGTGANLVPFLDRKLQITGIDPSQYMLDIAFEKVGHHVDLHRGFAEDLPFDDNSFNYACFITTLEFVEDPKKAIEEACRVAKDRIFIGVLNRYALKGIQLRLKGIFTKSIYNRAQFFSVWELKKIIRAILGDVSVSWRTVCQFLSASGKITTGIERLKLVQRCPFGAFAGIVFAPVPRYRTRPLSIKQTSNALAG
ncbi:MAG: class I SAM-dependent methyltransferase [Deltaproteobacteria bacterium]|nr:class I SAM-dependent methyltransferase [Deltaproteobacteria bacterium]